MAKLTTTYDSTLKEKIFVLKGEEAYARSTDCILEEVLHDGERRADWNTDIKKMKLEFHIDVLRDIGASYVTLYDNDDVIAVYDFDTNTHAIDLIYDEDTGIDNRIELAYDVEHHIYAKYMGNKQCLKSQSKSYMVSEPLPASYESSIEFSGVEHLYDVGSSDSITVKLIGADYYAEQKIIVWDNNNKIGEYTTDTDGEITVPLSNITEGKHSLLARFNGTDHLSSAEATIDYSGGAYPLIVSYPSYYINHETFPVTMRLMDYCGLPVANESLLFMGLGRADGVVKSVPLGSGVTDSMGEVAFVIDWTYSSQVVWNEYPTQFYARYGTVDSEQVTINKYENVTIALNQPTTLIGVNQSLTLTGQVLNVSEAVTVSLNQGLSSVKTDTNGNFTTTYIGTGAGDVTVTASISNVSSSVTFEDVLQYWKAPSTLINRNYNIYNATLSDLTNGYRITSSTITGGYLAFQVEDYMNIEFDVVSIDSLVIAFYSDDYSTASPVSNVKSGSKIKIVVNNGYGKVYHNNECITDAMISNNQIRFGVMGTNKYMTFNNLKFKRTS